MDCGRQNENLIERVFRETTDDLVCVNGRKEEKRKEYRLNDW